MTAPRKLALITGASAGIGAAFARGGKRIICLAGDGSVNAPKARAGTTRRSSTERPRFRAWRA